MDKGGKMRRKLKSLTSKKYFRIVIMIISITIILFALSIIILRYHVEGETDMPFKLSKISIISSSDGIEQEAKDTKWAFQVYQTNDVYIYIDKNAGYERTEAIKTVEIDNIQIESKREEQIKIYRPDEQEEKVIFKNKDENCMQTIVYTGDVESNIKQLKISNQGGLLAFRFSNEKLADFISNEEEIKHEELLKKAGVKQEDLESSITFNLIIKLEGGKEYKTTIHLEFPVDDVIEKGTTSQEMTDLKNFIFKRANH